MPTVAELERLQAILSRLAPLTNVQRGELIRAQDWNAVVGALLEVAQAVLAEERDKEPPPHEHADQVTPSWLDPRLRTLIERGPLADADNLARLAEVERRLDRLNSRGNDLDAGVKEVRERVIEVTTRDLTRQADITSVRRAIDGLGDGREDVRELRDSLSGIRNDLKSAIELGERLRVDNQPVNMQDVVDRLRNVEGLRDRLTTADGALFDAKGIELRFTQLSNTLVTKDELDAAIANRPVRITGAQATTLREELISTLRAEMATSQEQLAGDLRRQLPTLARDAAQQAQASVRDDVLGVVRPEIDRALTQRGDSLRTELDGKLTETARALQTQFDQARAGIEPAVREQVARGIAEHVRGTQDLMTELGKRLEVSERELRNQAVAIRDLSDRTRSIAIEEARRIVAAEAPGIVRDSVTLEVNRQVDVVKTDLRTLAREEARSQVTNLGPNIARTVVNERFGPR
ncbi:MAG TPA: hypothetical protein VJB57_15595 [Dehalococcoidia bacterium]|nr:hypothetical protein [Dehalococcoidia bacterium]